MDSVQLLKLAMQSVWHRKFSAAVVFSLTILLVLVGIALSPRKYRSEAKLFVRMGRESVALDPTATTGQTVAIQSNREIEVRSVRDMLASRVLLEKVVEQLGPEFILEPPMDLPKDSGVASAPAALPSSKWLKNQIAQLRKWAQTVRLSDPVPESDLAIRDLEKQIEVDGGSKSSVIAIEVVTKSPTAAQKVLEVYLDAYRELHVRVNRTPENYAFFESQTAELRDKLADARSELEAFKSERGVISIDVRKQNLQEHVSEIDVKIRSVKADLASAEASLKLSKQALGFIPDRLLTDQVQGLGDPARDSIRNSLFEIEKEAERVRQAYAEGHPERERVLAQAAAMRKIYDSETKERPTQTSTINQAYQEVQLKVIDTESRRAGIVAELAALEDQKTEVQQELKSLNATEMTLASLQEKVDLLQENHRQYSENLEQSRIDEELREMQISNVSVVQAPSLILQPVSPNKKLIALAGCILAMINAIGFAMWRNRAAFKTPGSVAAVPLSNERYHLQHSSQTRPAHSAHLRDHAEATASIDDGDDGGRLGNEQEDTSDTWAETSKDRSVAPR